MKPNYYKIIADCVENGAALGYNRAFKHSSDPTEYVIKEKIYDSIMELISENFIFDDLFEEKK